jgi:hypothetical protein
MTDIFNFNYEIKCASFDNNNNLYVATSTLVYLYNSSGNAVVSKTFNNIQAMTYDSGKIYLSDLVNINDVPNLNIYSIIESTLDASLCNPSIKLCPIDFKNYNPILALDGTEINIKTQELSVQNNLIYFVNNDPITENYGHLVDYNIRNSLVNPSRCICNITGSNQRLISDVKYSVYGKMMFYNNEQYIFGLSNIIDDKEYFVFDDDGYYYNVIRSYKRELINKFMRLNTNNVILSETTTQRYNFIFSTITSTGNIYIYETDEADYYINLYNNSGYQSTVYSNSIDLISGLISDNRGYAYAIKRNGSYSNIMILNSNIQSPYEIDTIYGNPSPCLNLKPNTYMYRSFQFSNPLNVQFSFDAYLFDNCTAYFNFFTDASGSNGGCLCLSTNSSGSGVTTSTSLSTGNKTDNNDYTIEPNGWHTYKITIDSNYNVIWFIDTIRQLNTIILDGINSSNNYCSFISNDATLLIDNIAILLN